MYDGNSLRREEILNGARPKEGRNSALCRQRRIFEDRTGAR